MVKKKKNTFADFILPQVTVEGRYRDSLYWDAAGKTLRAISAGKFQWEFEQVTNKGVKIRDRKHGITVIYGFGNVIVTQNYVENLNKFKEATSLVFNVVVKTLDVKYMTRLGNRFWYLFPLNSRQKGEKLLAEAQLVGDYGDRLKDFGDEITNRSVVLRLAGKEHHCRIALSVVEKETQLKFSDIDSKFFPEWAVLCDVDFYREGELKSGLDVSQFIHRNHKTLQNKLLDLLIPS
ncbi:hypothetical protein E3J62_04410 [candidate division TA06 bacterium]|uniref:Uncharacterized protein n=1 Tax=candidate division TA06 bacterium TaxID=2250710 RepID=A0A523UV34_UNCT6|nr:MAG: hypothetical protein E3J62_04410 [candidate division TA06 bacterium]